MLVVGTTTLTLKLAAPTPLLNHRLYREEGKYACGRNTYNFDTKACRSNSFTEPSALSRGGEVCLWSEHLQL